MTTSTKTYTVQVEDQICRSARIRVSASSAAEAALIARRKAFNGEVEMHYQDHHREPSIYEVIDVAQLGEKGFGTHPNRGCLCNHLESLLNLEGLPPEMLEDFEEYEGDTQDTGYLSQ